MRKRCVATLVLPSSEMRDTSIAPLEILKKRNRKGMTDLICKALVTGHLIMQRPHIMGNFPVKTSRNFLGRHVILSFSII